MGYCSKHPVHAAACGGCVAELESTIAELRLVLADARRRAFERAAEVVRAFGAQCAPGGVWVAEQICDRIEAEARKGIDLSVQVAQPPTPPPCRDGGS